MLITGFWLFYTSSGLSSIIFSTMFSSKLNGVTYPSSEFAFSRSVGISLFTYIFAFPFPFFASCTRFDTGEFSS